MAFKKNNYRNPVIQEDLKEIISDSVVDWTGLKHKTVLVTGANSMLATYIIYTLVYLNEHLNFHITILATVRDIKKAEERFDTLVKNQQVQLIQHDVIDPFWYEDDINFIIHAASNASPYFILRDPVGIMKANTIGTMNLLELSRQKSLENFLFLSTREIYGKSIVSDIDESAYGPFDILESRACYPESKRAAETLLKAYYDQYNVPFTVARLAHVYGPLMSVKNDGRIMSDLINNVLNNENIILKSDGSAERAFCYLSDATRALFLILLNGTIAEAYNVANEDEPIKIRDLAQLLVELFPKKNLQLVFDIPKETSPAYSTIGRTKLNTNKLENIGWQKHIKLSNGIVKTIKSFEE